MKHFILFVILSAATGVASAEWSASLGLGTCEADTHTVCDHGVIIQARLQYRKPIESVPGLSVVAEFNHMSHKDDDEPNRWFKGDFRGGSGLIESKTINLEYRW